MQMLWTAENDAHGFRAGDKLIVDPYKPFSTDCLYLLGDGDRIELRSGAEGDSWWRDGLEVVGIVVGRVRPEAVESV